MKNKKIFALLLVMVMVLSFALVACDTEGEDNTVWNEPTYQFAEDGSSCVATRVDSKDETHKETANATIMKAVTKPATFTTKGQTTYTATFKEDWATTQNLTLENIPIHSVSKVEAKAATYEEAGNIEYWEGTDGKYYEDEKHTVELKADEVILPSLYGVITININGVESNNKYAHRYLEDVTIDGLKKFIQRTTDDFITPIEIYSDEEWYEDFEDITTYAKENQNFTIYVDRGFELTFVNNHSYNKPARFIAGQKYKDVLPKVEDIVATKDSKGYIFEGWVDENDNPIDVESTIKNEDHKVYASWGLNYTLNENGNAVITKYEGVKKNLVIPAKLGGKDVVAINDFGLYSNEFLENITFEEGSTITSIGSKAFAYCDNLLSVTLPNSLTKIGPALFFSSEKVNNVKIDAGNALYTSNVDGVEFNGIMYIGAETIPAWQTHDQYGGNDFMMPEVTQNDIIVGCNSTTFPSTADAIAAYAFAGTGIKEANIPNTILSIGEAAFEYADLTNIKLPDNLTVLEKDVLHYCEQLTQLTIPANVERIDSFALCWNKGIKELTIPKSVKSIGTRAFWYMEGLTKVTFEAGTALTTIEGFAFEECKALESFTIPASVTNVGAGILNGCSAMTTLKVEDGNTLFTSKENGKELNAVIYIGENPYTPINSLSNVENVPVEKNSLIIGIKNSEIPAFATTIYDFAYCSIKMDSIRIPNTISHIGEVAFSSCELTEIIFDDGDLSLTIGARAFQANHLTKVVFPKRMEGKIAEGLLINNYKEVGEDYVTTLEYVSFENTTVNAIEGNVVASWVTLNLKYLILPSTIKTAATDAFGNYEGEGIYFVGTPDEALIKQEAFDGMKVFVYSETETAPEGPYAKQIDGYWTEVNGEPKVILDGLDKNNVTYALDEATQGYKVTGYNGVKKEIVIPETYNNKPVTVIGKNAFKNLDINSIILPNTIKVIEENAFTGTNIRRLVIPATVEKIGKGIVYGCEKLNTIKIDKENKFFTGEGDSVTYIGETPVVMGDFEYSKGALLVSLDGFSYYNNTVIKSQAFAKKSIDTLECPSTVTLIEAGAINVTQLDEAYIPSTVTTIEAGAIVSEQAGGLLVTDAKEKLAGWATDWITDNVVIYYGYDEETKHEYILVTNGGTIDSSRYEKVEEGYKRSKAGMLWLPNPDKTDALNATPCFEGWYTTPDFQEGTKVLRDFYTTEPSKKLYAKWMSEDDYYDGSSFRRAIRAENGNCVLEQKAGVPTYYKFTAQAYHGYDFTFFINDKTARATFYNEYEDEKVAEAAYTNKMKKTFILEKNEDIYIKVVTDVDLTRIDNLSIIMEQTK